MYSLVYVQLVYSFFHLLTASAISFPPAFPSTKSTTSLMILPISFPTLSSPSSVITFWTTLSSSVADMPGASLGANSLRMPTSARYWDARSSRPASLKVAAASVRDEMARASVFEGAAGAVPVCCCVWRSARTD